MSTPLIRICDIRKKFGSKEALKGVSFDLYAGELVSLLGVNGAGKTTLSTIVATLHPPSKGDMLYQERSIYGNLPAYRQIIGYCPQKPKLNPLLTVRKNLEYAGEYYGMSREQIEKRLVELNQQLGINEYLDKIG